MSKRVRRGNMLILIVAITLGIILVLVLFALSYTRFIGSGAEQRTAIEAAAIAAARDLSNIVIDAPEFGYVGLSDSAPVGTNTAAGDNYYTSVISINTLIGTARLDYIIGDLMQQNNYLTGKSANTWQTLALRDLASAKSAGAQLETALQNAIVSGGTGVDKNGQTLTPYKSAETAYQQNQIRMTGSSSYVAGSLKLSLGGVTNVATNVPVPTPTGSDPTINKNNSIEGMYRAYMDIPYKGQHFYFAGIGNSIKLVDPKNWTATVAGIPADSYFPTIVRAEAVQQLNDMHGKQSIKTAACAMPASVYDPKPAPGLLVISFPDGMPDKAHDGFPAAQTPNSPGGTLAPGDLYGAGLQKGNDNSDYYNSSSGDYPVSAGSSISFDGTWPLQSLDSNRLAANCCALAVFDWIRRAGTRADVESIIAMQGTPFMMQSPDKLWPPPGSSILAYGKSPVPFPNGIVHIYHMQADGKIYYQAQDNSPLPFMSIADQQQLMECHNALKDNAIDGPLGSSLRYKVDHGLDFSRTLPGVNNGTIEAEHKYDLYVRIYSRKTNIDSGGTHAGNPMDSPYPTTDSKSENISIDSGTSTTGRHRQGASPIVCLSKNQTHGQAECLTSIGCGKGADAMGAQGVAANVGKGALPWLGPQEDFMFDLSVSSSSQWGIDRTPIYYNMYSSGTGIRPTYKSNGVASEIRFRRQLHAHDHLDTYLGTIGYFVRR